jgi:hypothetical protein
LGKNNKGVLKFVRNLYLGTNLSFLKMLIIRDGVSKKEMPNILFLVTLNPDWVVQCTLNRSLLEEISFHAIIVVGCHNSL